MKKILLLIGFDLCGDLAGCLAVFSLLQALVFRGENELLSLAAMGAIRQLPSVLGGPLAGAAVDRFGPLPTTAVALALQGACALGLLLFPLSVGLVCIYPLYMCAALICCVGRLSLPPQVVSKNEILGLNALTERAACLWGLAIPGLTGWLVLVLGTCTATGLAAGLYLIALTCILAMGKSITRPGSKLASKPPLGQPMGLALGAYRKVVQLQPDLASHIRPYLFVVMAGGMLNLGLPLLFKTFPWYHIGTWGLVMSAYQAGGLLAATSLPRLINKKYDPSRPAIIFMALAPVMSLFVLIGTPIGTVFCSALAGFGFTCLHIRIESRIQQISPLDCIGIIMGIVTVCRGAGYLGAICIGSVVCAGLGPAPLFMLNALILVVGAYSSFANIRPKSRVQLRRTG